MISRAKVQRKTRTDIITKLDLTEKFYNRRIKAVAHLMPEMKARYSDTYPEIDIMTEFADMANDYYGAGMKPVTRMPHECGAIYKIGRKILIRKSIFEEYLHEQRKF